MSSGFDSSIGYPLREGSDDWDGPIEEPESKATVALSVLCCPCAHASALYATDRTAFFFALFCVSAPLSRSLTRLYYGIDGNTLQDCAEALFLSPCAAVQQHREARLCGPVPPAVPMAWKTGLFDMPWHMKDKVPTLDCGASLAEMPPPPSASPERDIWSLEYPGGAPNARADSIRWLLCGLFFPLCSAGSLMQAMHPHLGGGYGSLVSNPCSAYHIVRRSLGLPGHASTDCLTVSALWPCAYARLKRQIALSGLRQKPLVTTVPRKNFLSRPARQTMSRAAPNSASPPRAVTAIKSNATGPRRSRPGPLPQPIDSTSFDGAAASRSQLFSLETWEKGKETSALVYVPSASQPPPPPPRVTSNPSSKSLPSADQALGYPAHSTPYLPVPQELPPAHVTAWQPRETREQPSSAAVNHGRAPDRMAQRALDWEHQGDPGAGRSFSSLRSSPVQDVVPPRNESVDAALGRSIPSGGEGPARQPQQILSIGVAAQHPPTNSDLTLDDATVAGAFLLGLSGSAAASNAAARRHGGAHVTDSGDTFGLSDAHSYHQSTSSKYQHAYRGPLGATVYPESSRYPVSGGVALRPPLTAPDDFSGSSGVEFTGEVSSEPRTSHRSRSSSPQRAARQRYPNRFVPFLPPHTCGAAAAHTQYLDPEDSLAPPIPLQRSSFVDTMPNSSRSSITPEVTLVISKSAERQPGGGRRTLASSKEPIVTERIPRGGTNYNTTARVQRSSGTPHSATLPSSSAAERPFLPPSLTLQHS